MASEVEPPFVSAEKQRVAPLRFGRHDIPLEIWGYTSKGIALGKEDRMSSIDQRQ
jgi:hypothetical protein